MARLFASLPFLFLLIIPENGANHKRFFQHDGGSSNGGVNNSLVDPLWNGTFVMIPGGFSHHSSILTVSPGAQSSEGSLPDTQKLLQTPLSVDIRVGFMIGSARKHGDEEYSRPGLTIAGGLTYALYSLQHSNFFAALRHPVNIKFSLTVAETYGDEDKSLLQVAELWRRHNVSVIIGPQETCLHEAKLASSLNIPMISYVSNKSLLVFFSLITYL